MIEKLTAKKYVAPPQELPVPIIQKTLQKPPKLQREVSLEVDMVESKVSTQEKLEEKPKKTKKQIAKENKRLEKEQRKAEKAKL